MRMPGSGQPFRREKILAEDARKDLEHELTSYFEDASEQSKLAQYLDANQQQELHALEQEDREDIAAFLSLAREEGVSLTTEVGFVSREAAEEQLARSGPNALFVIDRYLDAHHLKTPEMMAFCTRRLVENPYSEPIFQILRDTKLYEDAYEAQGVISNACAALEVALTRAHQHSYEAYFESIAHELIEIKSSVPTHHEDIERLLALTGSETAHAYFAHTQNTLLDLSVARDLLDERHQNDSEDSWDHHDGDRHREGWFHDYDGDRDYYGRDDYEEDHGDYFKGAGLEVYVDPRAEAKEIFNEQGEPVTSDRPLVSASINFTPGGQAHYSPERRTEFLFIGYTDFKNLFERIDTGEVPHIDVFEGFTNREMAKASLILGFRITPMGEEDISGRLSAYRVVGLQEDVRRRISELEARKFKDGTPLFEKMRERSERQQLQREAA